MKVLNEEQLDTFIAAIEQEPHWFDFFYTAITTGMRLGEITALQWDDFDTWKGTLRICKTLKFRTGDDFYTESPKTQASRRTIFLPPSTAEILRQRKETAITQWIFYNPLCPEKPIHHSVALRKLKAILASATKMQQVAASAIDRRISKSRAIMFVPGNMTPLPEKKAFVPKARKYRKSGTGCISKIGENLFEGKYSPKWIDGKKRQFNVYASTRGECEEKLAKMIAGTKDELEKLKKATPPKPQKEIKILLY